VKKIITNFNDNYNCCKYDINNHECGCLNYISLSYSKNVEYEYGFNFNKNNENIESRNNIIFIYIDNIKYEINGKLTIKANSEVKLCFRKPATSFEKFFDANFDSNAENIISIDLSHFDTSLVNNMNSIFSGCKELVFLEMSNLNLKNIEKAEDMFNNIANLKYIILNNTKINNEFKSKLNYSELSELNLIVCQSEEILFYTYENYKFICCDYNIERKKCQSNNYIIAKYKTQTNYNNGFLNEYRKGINFINNGKSTLGPNDSFIIEENIEIEIHFTEPIKSLFNFFYKNYDQYAINITSIDLSHFNSSLVESTQNMFRGCKFLKEINFTDFDTSKIISMQTMFYGCSGLESLDLSNFNTSNVNNMEFMFSGCSGLKSLDLSNFNTSNVNNMQSFINGCKSLKYINIYNAQYNEVSKSYFNNWDHNNDLIVYQREEIIKNAKNNCSIFDIPITNDQNNNYIIVKYKTQSKYEKGFQNEYRQGIKYIINGDSTVGPNKTLAIEGNIEIQIHFVEPIKSLDYFFYYDDNADKVISIDLSYFNSSLITDTQYMFGGCSSLKEINFTNFDTSNVINMGGMFINCTSLEFLDISNFDTSKVNNMSNMLGNCESLKFLDISNYNLTNVKDIDNMFSNLNNLRYLNLYNANYNDNFKSYISNTFKKNLVICEKGDILTGANIIKKCCDSINILDCDVSENYIIIYYGSDATYENGFKMNYEENTEFRKGINFIFNEIQAMYSSDKLELKSSSKLEIHFSDSVKSLANFFNSEYDKYMENIISIDFSHFDSSLITDMNSLFKGCKSLKTIIFTNFNTSSVSNMNEMFSGCTALQILDLKNFITNEVTNMNKMFSGCDNLKYLDISQFNVLSNDIFNDLNNLEFINIYKAQNFDINSINNNNLKICQKEKKIKNIENKCGYYNIESKQFDSKNLIIIYFDKDVEYKSGFINNIESRKNIDFIINGYHADKIKGNEYLNIHKGQKIEIYLQQEITNLKSFFDSDLDSNMLNMISIDFTLFDSSLVRNMENLFKGCSELKDIDFTNFNTSLVNNMNSMFSGCSKLIELDLSFFNTSLVIDMHDMFNGCTLLEVIVLYNIKMDKIITAHNMFKNNDILKYIDLSHVKDSYLNITESTLNRKDDLIICQNDNIIINTKTTYQCCYYNTKLQQCESKHNIILFYGNDALYESGFGSGTNNNTNIEYRNNIAFLAINRKKIDSKDTLYISPHIKVEIHFSSNISTLENYFSSKYDENAKNIEKIELSKFISSTITNISHIFEGCTSLKSINFSNFNTTKVNDMSHMLSGCNSLESIDLSNFDTSSVIDMSYLFFNPAY